jgi:hypothetical protein
MPRFDMQRNIIAPAGVDHHQACFLRNLDRCSDNLTQLSFYTHSKSKWNRVLATISQIGSGFPPVTNRF